MEKNLKVRDSNIELYRIISMLCIIAHHYVVNSGLLDVMFLTPISPKTIFLSIFGAFGKIGINCFVLITGYFMCQSQISAKKFAKLFFELMFYRIVINVIFWLTSYNDFSLVGLVNVLIPFKSIAQNFTGTFLMFFLFIPFLNKLIHSLNEKQHFMLILLSCLVYVLFGTIPKLSVRMNYTSWYMVLYFIASYLRIYPKKWHSSSFKCGLFAIVSIFLAISSVIAGDFLLTVFKLNLVYYFVTDSNTLLALLVGISTFMFFKSIKIKYSKLINTVSSTCFGVLLIHANGDVMRNWLWRDTLKNTEMYGSKYLYLHAILSVVVIFVVCSVIDMLRIKFVEKPFFALWDKCWEKSMTFYKKSEEKILKFLSISV